MIPIRPDRWCRFSKVEYKFLISAAWKKTTPPVGGLLDTLLNICWS